LAPTRTHPARALALEEETTRTRTPGLLDLDLAHSELRIHQVVPSKQHLCLIHQPSELLLRSDSDLQILVWTLHLLSTGLSSYLTLTSCRSFWIRNNLCVWPASDTAYHDFGLRFFDWLWKHSDHHERLRSKYRNQWRLIWRETYNIGVWRWIFWRRDWRIRKHWRLWN
jgi:hypothetical protein